MENIITILYGIGFMVWLFAFISALKNSFHNNMNKLIWIIVLIFIPISAILYFFIAPKQIKTADSKQIEVAMTLELRTDTEQKAIDIINELKQDSSDSIEKRFKNIVKKNPKDTELTHSKKDGYWALRVRSGELLNAIKISNNGELYQNPIKYDFKDKTYYFVLYLIDKKYEWV